MGFDFKFPDVGEGIVEGEVIKWRVLEGDSVKQDQVIVDIETDKAVVEIPSPKEGKILKIHHKAGDTIKVGEVLCTIGKVGESPAKPQQAPEKPKESFSVVGEIPEELPGLKEHVEKAVEKTLQSGVKALPAVRRLAKELKVPLEGLQGTGKEGRLTEEDVRKAAGPSQPKPALKVTKKYDMWGYVDRLPLKGIRKATARHIAQAVTNQALVTHMDVFDVTDLWDLREKEKASLKKEGIHLTFMPFIVKAVVQALKKHPYLNSSMDNETEEILLKKYYNIGVAVDSQGGLVVPVVKGADQKSIKTLGKEIQDLAERVRERKIDLADLKGGTFTITNVGSIGGLFSTPVPNYPESAILATGRISEKPIVIKGMTKIRKILPISITFDHKVLDGAEVAAFSNTLKKYLEDTDLLLMEE